MIAPVSKLKKVKIVWLGNHRCRHNHTYLEHYACYLEEHPEERRVGYIDIETTDFKADWGIMLCWAILPEVGKARYDLIKPEDMRNEKVMDKVIVSSLVRELANYDLLVGYYHSGFDLKFIRTRAVSLNIPFPAYDSIMQRDVYYMVRHKFALTSNRQENACKALLGSTLKTKMDKSIWRKAAMCGDKKSLAFIMDHCIRDVIDCRKLYHKVEGYVKNIERSI